MCKGGDSVRQGTAAYGRVRQGTAGYGRESISVAFLDGAKMMGKVSG